MAIIRKGFLFGFLVGVAATMLLLEAWALHLSRVELDAAQVEPALVAALARQRAISMPKSSGDLSRPWLPESSSTSHDAWKTRALDGTTASLADFKGRAVFLNFWSTSCVPCIAELPGIEELADSMKGDCVAFLAVARFSDPGQVRRFLQEHPFHFPVYLSEQDVPEDFAAQGVPTTIILDASGRAVFRHVGALNWNDDEVRTYLRSLAAHSASNAP